MKEKDMFVLILKVYRMFYHSFRMRLLFRKIFWTWEYDFCGAFACRCFLVKSGVYKKAGFNVSIETDTVLSLTLSVIYVLYLSTTRKKTSYGGSSWFLTLSLRINRCSIVFKSLGTNNSEYTFLILFLVRSSKSDVEVNILLIMYYFCVHLTF